MSYKDRVANALLKYHAKQLKKDQGPTRKNKKPEKQVEKECLIWMRSRGWSVQIYESKATYDRKGFWRNQAMKAGNADCQGNDNLGNSVVIEFKAPGKLSTFGLDRNYRQQQYIREKIETGSFACVVDSPTLLETIYAKWRTLKDIGAIEDAKSVLRNALPIKVSAPLE